MSGSARGRVIGLVLVVALIMVLSSSVAAAGLAAAAPVTPANPSSPVSVTPAPSPSNSPNPAPSASPPSASPSGARALGINSVLANSVKAKEQTILADGGSLAGFHPPNLHQAPALSQTHGVVTPLYSVAPAPMGVAYYGLSNTTGTVQGTVTNTTSLAGSWNTTTTEDSLGTAAELFDTSSGNAAGSFGAQLNTVLVNVTIMGDTSFANPSDSNEAPGFCPTTSYYYGLPGNACPNEFWLQNYIQYTESSHSLTISNEIWNFSNPAADWASSQSSGTNTLDGFGHLESGEVYQGPSSGTITIPAPYTFSLVLYINYTQGPCHTDAVAGTGIATCPASYGTTYPLNELFMNYTIRSSTGARLCPSSIPTGRVCGEDDDIFWNSLASGASSGVPLYGPCLNGALTCSPQSPSNARVGSATIQANGTGYNPVGLTNDYEFDYGIGSDDGATNNIVYQDGIVGLGYCQNSHAIESSAGGIECGTGPYGSYSATPAAADFGGETGETSTGEMAYWAPQGTAGLGPTFQTGKATPVTYLDTGPSLLVGLWNMTGSTDPPVAQPYTGHAPYPAYEGGEPLSYANIAPANAWVGIAQDSQTPVAGAGTEITSQEYFQVAPTFGFFSYWKGSGGDLCGAVGALGCSHIDGTTSIGSNLWLPTGWYTIEVLLSGYAPVIRNLDITGPTAPSITLSPSYSTGAYTPDWAFSNTDLANLSVSASNTVPTGAGTSGSPYVISAGPPNVGTVSGVVLGEPGSLSWLFSNLNDYDFTVWIGGFINSTTAVTQFNPAPSFPMVYPTWQYGGLSNAVWNLPTTDGFQYYLLNSQNLAVIGASDLYAWANQEATTIYEVVVNNGANDLIADNHFNVTNRGIDFTGGGTTDTSTINGAPVTFQYDSVTRNAIWGNTFQPDPLSAPYVLDEPFTAQDSLTLGEAFDRVAANSFDNASGSAVNATANAGATDSTFWNVTCVSGYHPLAQETYPGSPNPGTGVCQPLTNSETLDGFTMTGSAAGASYQGGNFWYSYGKEPNPYGNIPYKARLTSLTGTAEIAATGSPYFGDMAPLIPYFVSELTFKETGLPSSATTTEFTMRITNTTTGYTWLNTSATSATPAGCATSTVCVNFYVEFGTYTYVATPPSGYSANPAVGSVTFATASTLVVIAFGISNTVTYTETGLPASTRWYVNTTGQVSLTSTITTISQNLAAGTYSYSTATVNKAYECSGFHGSVTVSGTTSVPITCDSTLQATISPSSPQTTQVGGSVDYTAGATGGIAPITWTLQSNQPGSPLNLSASTFTATQTGTWTVYLNTTDSNGYYSNVTATVVVEPGLVATLSPGTATTQVGGSVTYTVGTTGGVAPITWTLQSNQPGSPLNLSASTFTALQTGTWTVYLNATDAVGSISDATATVTVEPALVAMLSPGTAAADVGGSVTYTVGTTGGVAPITWTLQSNQPGSPSNLSSETFTATQSGTWTVYLNATDAVGSISDTTATVTVNLDPTVSVAPTGPLSYDVGEPAAMLTAMVTYTGSNTASVEWYSSATSACSASSTDTGVSGLTYTPSTPAAATTYYCAVVSDSGVPGYMSPSNAVEVTVTADPIVSVAPIGPLDYVVGSTAGALTATVTYTGPNTASVEWYRSSSSTCNAGSTDTGMSGLTFTPSTVSAGTTWYCAVVSDSGVSGYHSASNAVEVTVTTPAITVSPTQGPVGATVTVSGTGFSVSSTLSSLVFDGVTISTCTSGSFTTSAAGSFSCTFKVPSGTSGTSVVATDAAGPTATGTFTVTTLTVGVTPGQGPVGAMVTVSGTGFSVSSTVGLVVDNVVITSCTSGSLTTSATGSFSCTLKVPSGTSGTTVTATDVGGQYVTGTFTVTTPRITVSPMSGAVGSTVTVSGTGFSVSNTVGLVFDGVTVSSCPIGGGLSASGTGAFSCTFAVPSGTSGTTVTATDVGGQTAAGTFTVFTVGAPSITVTPGQGPVGATVTVAGTSFTASSVVKLDFDGVMIKKCTSGSLTTSGTGTFSCTFLVPKGTSGTTVTATDVSSKTATGSFTVTTPAITVTPGQGPIGATVTVSGTGFSVSSGVGLVFDSKVITACTSGSLMSSASGAFSCTFSVPSGTTGTTVKATDVGGQHATGTFKVTKPKITVTPKKGAVDATVTVSGTGFSVSSVVGLVFDGVTISSCTSGSLTTSSAGAFSCTFSVPSGTSGTTVTATDVGGQTATGKFTVT